MAQVDFLTNDEREHPETDKIWSGTVQDLPEVGDMVMFSLEHRDHWYVASRTIVIRDNMESWIILVSQQFEEDD